MLHLFYLSFNSALCAFAHFSFGFANIWKRAAGGCLSPHEAAEISFLAKESPGTAGGTAECAAQSEHLHRQGLSGVTLGELHLSQSSSLFPG